MIYHELKRKGVTLFLLWEEYKAVHPDGFQYSWFCKSYREWAGKVDLVMRQQGDSVLQRVPMLPNPEGPGYEVRLFDVSAATEYYIEAGAVRSPAFHVEVLELPYVDAIDLELHFPRYTGLETRVIEGGGDVVAPVGTTVRLRARLADWRRDGDDDEDDYLP